MRLTYKVAKTLCAPGECVWYFEEGKIVSAKILSIRADSLHTADGDFCFDTVGKEWFLTNCGIRHALCESGGGKVKWQRRKTENAIQLWHNLKYHMLSA